MKSVFIEDAVRASCTSRTLPKFSCSSVAEGHVSFIGGVFLILAFTCPLPGQEFDVVSVKPNKSAAPDSHFMNDRSTLQATNISLRGLITRAYGIQDYQLEGPDWIKSERFDVTATLPELSKDGSANYGTSFQAMMQHMLADRFKLEVHREHETRPVYALVVGKSGIKFKEAANCDSHGRNRNGTHLVATCIAMDSFAEVLSARVRDLPVDLPVIDMTELKGVYDFNVDWVPEPKPSGEGKADNPVLADRPSGVTLLVALEEQLGLKLETRKAPIEILIVDHAEKVPSEN